MPRSWRWLTSIDMATVSSRAPTSDSDMRPVDWACASVAICCGVAETVTVRYQPLFSDPRSVSQMRVLFKGRVFAIHGALNEDEANVAVILLASEGVRDG